MWNLVTTFHLNIYIYKNCEIKSVVLSHLTFLRILSLHVVQHNMRIYAEDDENISERVEQQNLRGNLGDHSKCVV